MLPETEQLRFSPYIDLYDKLIPKNHMLREMKELVDFSFVNPFIEGTYCSSNGRNAVLPSRMFRYLVLKILYSMSDADLIERARFDMSFKYFLDLCPEDDVIHPSLLSKFRRKHLIDDSLLDKLIVKTVEIAKEQGVLRGKAILMDSSHTVSRYHKKSAGQYLADKSKLLRKKIYTVCDSLKSGFPEKPESMEYEAQKEYSEKLLAYLKKRPETEIYQPIKEAIHFFEENMEDLEASDGTSDDKDAKTGHKTADSSFYGYKTHIAMNEDRLITAAIVSTGEKTDGQYLPDLVEKTEAAGYAVEEVLADKAYSIKDNLEYTNERNIKLYSALNKSIGHEAINKIKGFEYNKDADMYICPAGHMATNKKRNAKKNQGENPQIRYYFDVQKCKCCPKREGCYKEGAKSKCYTIKEICPEHQKQMAFQETEEFQERIKERYKIEAKNGELKNRHGYDTADYSGINGMQIQGAITLFSVNLKRILKLRNEKIRK